MVARFQEPKDHIGLFRALAALKTRDWSLELIGGGPLLAKMRTLAADLGLEQQLIFSGECTDVEVRLAKAQIFILLSRREGFPRSILEAMRAGLPVIASNVGGICEALTHGGNGYLLPAEGDTESLLQFLLPLLDSPALREKMGGSGTCPFRAGILFPSDVSENARFIPPGSGTHLTAPGTPCPWCHYEDFLCALREKKESA